MLCKSLLAATLAATALCSPAQQFPGLQLKLEQSFIDMFTQEFYAAVVPSLFEDINAMLPTNFGPILGLEINEIGFKDLQLDPSNAYFKIDPASKQIDLKFAEIVNLDFHFKVTWTVAFIFGFHVNVDIRIIEANLKSGIQLESNLNDGTPELYFHNTDFNLGKSRMDLTGNFVAEIVAFFANFFVTPIQVLVNTFFDPAVNFLLNTIVIPTVIPGGVLFYQTELAHSNTVQNLLLDIGFPLEPLYTSEGFELFTNAALYFQD